MSEFNGFIFSKLHLIGSRSEGPTYYLQQFDYSEFPIKKQAKLWEQDPNLQKKLGTKVAVDGELSAGWLHYDSITPYSLQPRAPGKQEPRLKVEQEQCLKVDLKVETEELWLNKMPPSPHPKPFKIALEVEWPYRSIWKGICPSSQVYDFFVEFEGEPIWQWSQNKFFVHMLTPVWISGGSPYTFSETWVIEPEIIKSEGLYTVRGLFIASGQEVEKQVQIRFAH